MSRNENPAPRANAGSRGDFKAERSDIRASASEWEAGRDGVPPCRPRMPQEGLHARGPIDFVAINQAALAAFPGVLNRLLPRGKAVGREIVALNPRRADQNLGSFKVNRFNGRWCDFATGDKGGDVVSLVAYLEGVSQGEAARRLARMLGLEIGGRRHG